MALFNYQLCNILTLMYIPIFFCFCLFIYLFSIFSIYFFGCSDDDWVEESMKKFDRSSMLTETKAGIQIYVMFILLKKIV